jgi:hypothetical protein
MFSFLTDSVLDDELSVSGVLACMAASVLFGVIAALVYRFRENSNKRFTVTIAMLPIIVQIIIMLVNGRIGAGIAVAGAFSLVRFRSIPGNARDITAIFFAMALGFVTGMGYLFYGFIFLVVMIALTFIYPVLGFGKEEANIRILKITIPENLDYEGLFDAAFEQFTESAVLDQVRTTNMGSLFELTYRIQLKTGDTAKAFVDALRTLNGNLTVSVSREQPNYLEL